ncbi:hypothetical protein B0T14DRAFT_552848 [Immersiella caudata]|uniref:Uncharacterized protein n=1 Tax=Immersiella caudata TaxID=314043 RepID=A0AA39WVL0_9PEZI|nr:hypothetical protein B0T14DRAFT_552848 [Immersiella caudata]
MAAVIPAIAPAIAPTAGIGIGGAINIVGFLGSGLLAIPGILSFFNKEPANTITVNIGVGDTNSSAPLPFKFGNQPNGETLGGSAPEVALFDGNGRLIGRAHEHTIVTSGGAISLKITGKSGTSVSQVPEYIQLIHKGAVAGPVDPICVSWITTTSSSTSNSDFRSWNAATARACDIPWYPSSAQMGGVQSRFQPPCFWMDGSGKLGGEFPVAMSARLLDFFFPGAPGLAEATAKQWSERPDTLCEAPGRQNFYKKAGDCIPYYPTGLSEVNMKDPDNGYDFSFTSIKQGHVTDCKNPGERFKRLRDFGGAPVDPKVEEFVKTAELKSNLILGPLAGRAAKATGTATESGPTAIITEGARLPRDMTTGTILDRRVENRLQEPGKWCQERRLVISEFEGHSAKDVCESGSSWGPDMAVVPEGLFCDMCTRKVYPICGAKKKKQAPGEFGILGGQLCFDLKVKELRVQGKIASRQVLESEGVKMKEYEVVKEWK